ncbi:MAG: DUF938 domain-containing protein [Candidatus Aenigmarchaeota archaeon]|nr:DUF938 domain-containing protein [Candidatus Aenigmarchaeota archaeon]
MGVTVEELAAELDVRPVSLAEYDDYIRSCGEFDPNLSVLDVRRSSLLDEQARMFDGNALPPTAAIAPIVSRNLEGAKSVMEIGFGTGFRALYYAMNNPETRVIAIDKNPHSAVILKRRTERLGVRNLNARTADFLDTSYRETAQHVVFVDVIQECEWEFYRKALSRTIYGNMPAAHALIRLASKKFSRRKPNYLILTTYGCQNNSDMERFTLGAGFRRCDISPFEYVKPDDEPRKGNVLVLS